MLHFDLSLNELHAFHSKFNRKWTFFFFSSSLIFSLLPAVKTTTSNSQKKKKKILWMKIIWIILPKFLVFFFTLFFFSSSALTVSFQHSTYWCLFMMIAITVALAAPIFSNSSFYMSRFLWADFIEWFFSFFWSIKFHYVKRLRFFFLSSS